MRGSERSEWSRPRAGWPRSAELGLPRGLIGGRPDPGPGNWNPKGNSRAPTLAWSVGGGPLQ